MMDFIDSLKKSDHAFASLYDKIDNAQDFWCLSTEIEQELLDLNDQQKITLLIDIMESLSKLQRGADRSQAKRKRQMSQIVSFLVKSKMVYEQNADPLLYQILEFFKSIIHNICTELQLPDDIDTNDLQNKIDFFNELVFQYANILKPALNNLLRYHTPENPAQIELLVAIQSQLKILIQYQGFKQFNHELNKQTQKITEILNKRAQQLGKSIAPVYFVGQDDFSGIANQRIDDQNESDKGLWFQLMALAQKSNTSKPSQKYLNEAKTLINALGTDKFQRLTHAWFEDIIELQGRAVVQYGSYSIIEFLDPLNSDVIKGFIWMSSCYDDKQTVLMIGRLAEKCFKKIPNKGAAAPAVGNACLYTLSVFQGLDGVAQLSKLKLKIKQNTTAALIEKYINLAASKLGVTAIEVEDLAVDHFNIKNNQLKQYFGDVTAILTLTAIGKSVIKWFNSCGGEQKLVPQLVKDQFADALKELKATQKQIDQTTAWQKERFDRMLRTNRAMSLAYFQEKYLNHGLISFVIQKMIFKFSNDSDTVLAIYIDDQWLGIDHQKIDCQAYTTVTLWHPVTSTTQEVKAWRDFLVTAQIQQPFKQAYREIYILTDAEVSTRTYSNRMASHILKQHQYVALAKGRGWQANLIGAWDGGDHNIAKLLLPEYSLKVEYWVNAVALDNQLTSAGVWSYVTTDQIRFVSIQTGEAVELVDVPPIAFSESMRDVDLFVGVASVGNDPAWTDSGGLLTYRTYWQSYAFGDLSEVANTRKEILQNLLPKLKIAKVAQIVDKFLVVKGHLRTYKIHIGSTNILMEPNDQYLCIVPDRSKGTETPKVFLPFEGDDGLSVIISKALLLASDDKITDGTIISQINR